jgi:hypothetical protein
MPLAVLKFLYEAQKKKVFFKFVYLFFNFKERTLVHVMHVRRELFLPGSKTGKV